MYNQLKRSDKIALKISNFTNPSILSQLILVLIAVTKISDIFRMIGCVAVILLFFAVIPMFYIYIRLLRHGNDKTSIGTITKYLKKHPREILILTFSLGIPSLLILYLLKAPNILISTLVALLFDAAVTATLNIFYRVSFHMAALVILIFVIAEAWARFFYSFSCPSYGLLG